MLNAFDDVLNRITMYRLLVYCLAGLLIVSLGLSYSGNLPFSPLELIVSTAVILSFSFLSNEIFAIVYQAPSNRESVLITGLILSLIISPGNLTIDRIIFLAFAGILANASKYIFAYHKKHLFNPAALAAVILITVLGRGASWWIGTLPMFPAVLFVTVIIGRKLRRLDLIFTFFLTASLAQLAYAIYAGKPIVESLIGLIANTALVFFAGVMLTEPQTMPGSKAKRTVYGVLIGALFPSFVHLGSVYSTPEISLLIGNLYSFLSGVKAKFLLTLKEKIIVADRTVEFLFASDKPINFQPGQYLELTLKHRPIDQRGMRRYFTIASSPLENEIRFAARFYSPSSSFKKTLANMESGQGIVAGQLAGDFTLPGDPNIKLCFIAGGIGITPFRSMIKYLFDRGEIRDIVLIYSNNREQDIAYKELFDEAVEKLAIKVFYIITGSDNGAKVDGMLSGKISGEMLMNHIPDYMDRLFYVSGPQGMVDGSKKILRQIGLNKSQIKTDYFSGY